MPPRQSTRSVWRRLEALMTIDSMWLLLFKLLRSARQSTLCDVTISNFWSPIFKWWKSMGSFRKQIRISLHFLALSFIQLLELQEVWSLVWMVELHLPKNALFKRNVVLIRLSHDMARVNSISRANPSDRWRDVQIDRQVIITIIIVSLQPGAF